MSQVYVGNGSGGGGGSGIQTINGDTGSITGSTVTIYANNAANKAGSSVLFVNSGTVSTFTLEDANFNILMGNDTGNFTLSGTGNTGIGDSVLQSLTTGFSNTAYGGDSLLSLTDGNSNTALGAGTLEFLLTGIQNLCLGALAGADYVGAESSNILLANTGIVGDSNVMRLGSTGSGSGNVNKAFLAGTNGVTVSNQLMVVMDSSTEQLGTAAIPGTTLNVQTFTTSGVYTPTVGMRFATIEVCGGGGGGGGADTSGGGNAAPATGGGGGGYGRKTVNAATIGVSQTVTIGAGGAGGAAGPNNGTTGGTTSVGAIVTATGGTGGNGAANVYAALGAYNAGVAGGVGTSGDINANGGYSQQSAAMNAPGFGGFGFSGAGGSSIFGSGAPSVPGINAAGSAGIAGVVYGGGGSGAITINLGVAAAGGDGAAGIVIITEYI